ncbi:hypothetical protein Hanom_Chr02g00142321 [Helianthus anomalus]
MLKNLDVAESKSKVGGDGNYDDSKKKLGFAIGRFFIDAGIRSVRLIPHTSKPCLM